MQSNRAFCVSNELFWNVSMLIEVLVGCETNSDLIVEPTKYYFDFEVAFYQDVHIMYLLH